jgi:hypothetical protein
MQYINTMVNYVGSFCFGVNLTQFMQWGGKKIDVSEDPVLTYKFVRLFIGCLAPPFINRTAEYLVLDKDLRLVISVGVIAESIWSGVRLGVDGAQTQQFKDYGELAGKIAAYAGTFFLNVDRGAQMGFLASFLTVEYLQQEN